MIQLSSTAPPSPGEHFTPSSPASSITNMAELDQIQRLHARVSELLAVQSLQSYSQALSVVEEFTELASSSPHPDSPATVELLHNCNLYRMLCNSCISRLTRQTAAPTNRCAKSKRKRQGVIFNVDKGDHIAAALEALQLEEVLEKEAREDPKHVYFSN